MKTIKIIDLLVKIANGEKVPKRIKYDYHYYIYDKLYNTYFQEMSGGNKLPVNFENLNDEVEVIEDTPKKYIEHIKMQENELHNHLNIIEKLNEIIDKINGE